MWQVAAFIDVRVVKPIVIGGDDLTRDFNVVDAASFSSAIPGVLHHETSDPRMLPVLDAVLEDNGIAAIVDGGACYLAFDCFHPQWDAKHLWLVPITQAIQLQMVRNAPYADHLVRFAPTLSPANLAPSVATIDRACEWGRISVDRAIPVTAPLPQPTWWKGDADQPFRALAEPPPDLTLAAQRGRARFGRLPAPAPEAAPVTTAEAVPVTPAEAAVTAEAVPVTPAEAAAVPAAAVPTAAPPGRLHGGGRGDRRRLGRSGSGRGHRCGADRDRDSARRQHRCDALQSNSHNETSFDCLCNCPSRFARQRAAGVTADTHFMPPASR
jgi:hypothetical protein